MSDDFRLDLLPESGRDGNSETLKMTSVREYGDNKDRQVFEITVAGIGNPRFASIIGEAQRDGGKIEFVESAIAILTLVRSRNNKPIILEVKDLKNSSFNVRLIVIKDENALNTMKPLLSNQSYKNVIIPSKNLSEAQVVFVNNIADTYPNIQVVNVSNSTNEAPKTYIKRVYRETLKRFLKLPEEA